MTREPKVMSDITPFAQGHRDKWQPFWPHLSLCPANGRIGLFSGFTDGSGKPRNDRKAAGLGEPFKPNLKLIPWRIRPRVHFYLT